MISNAISRQRKVENIYGAIGDADKPEVIEEKRDIFFMTSPDIICKPQQL